MRERELTAGLVRRAAAAGRAGPGPHRRHPRGRAAGPDARRGRDRASRDFEDNLGRLDDLARARIVPASLDDVGWLAEISGGLPVVVKGVLRADDAAACLAAGAAGVIVSNHGGRQLDQALPTALALPAVRAAAAGRPVFVDGGVRSAGARPRRAGAGRATGLRGPPRALGAGLRRGRRRAGVAGGPDRRPGPRDGAGRGRRRWPRCPASAPSQGPAIDAAG